MMQQVNDKGVDITKVLCILGALAAATPLSPTDAATADGPPTFNTEVAPILYKNCINCHRPEGSGSAVSLLSYDTAKPWAAPIKRQVLARQMPPWPADAHRSMKFRNDARLSQQDIGTLVAWADAGAPKGGAADPPPPSSPRHWLHPQGLAPDAVIALPEFTVPATGEIPYVARRVKVPLTEDKWIAAIQVRPGNEAVVHHMGITEIVLDEGISAEQADAFSILSQQLGIADGSLTTFRAAVADPINSNAYDMLAVYTPGSTFESFEGASAKLLKAGANYYINFNIHYTAIGTSTKDHSQLALWFRSKPAEHQLFRSPAATETIISNGRELLSDDPGTKAEGTYAAIPPIPRYADNYELIGISAYTAPVTIYQLQPHAHMRGKDFTYAVVYPDGHEQTLLTVPKYDFHYQPAYELDAPLQLPAGSKLVVTAHYDNSRNNVHLRNLGSGELGRNCGPDKEAYFRRQNQTWHEMFSPLVQYSIDQPKAGANKRDPQVLGMVEIVGCLGQEPASGWMLMNAGRPHATTTQSTSSAAIHSSRAVALGAQEFELLGASFFGPQRYANHKVAVKGVLIADSQHRRLNVTSLQALAETCL
jgi:cytochrome c553